MVLSRYRVYRRATSFGIRCACCEASSTVGRLGLGAFRFLAPGDTSPSSPSPLTWPSRSLFTSSFSNCRYSWLSDSGASLLASYRASVVISGTRCRSWEILLKLTPSTPSTPSCRRAWKTSKHSSGVKLLWWMGTMKLALVLVWASAVEVALAAGFEAAAGSDCCERCKARIAVYTPNAHRVRVQDNITMASDRVRVIRRVQRRAAMAC